MSANKVVVVGPPSASTTTATPVPAGSTGMAALSALHQQQSQSQPIVESVKKMDKKNLNDLDLQVKGKFYPLLQMTITLLFFIRLR